MNDVIMLAECMQEEGMPTLTIRNVPEKVVRSLKLLAQRNQRSMEQEIRDILQEQVGDRISALEQIEKSWERQSRRPKAGEVNSWIRSGRE
jgi:hypothetical protein